MKPEDRIYTIDYQGKTIYYTDWSNILDGDEFENAIRYTSLFVVEQNKYELLELLNVKGSFFTRNVFKTMQEMAKLTRKFNKKKAVVGDFSTTRMFMLKTINQITRENITPFTDVEAAKKWLVSE